LFNYKAIAFWKKPKPEPPEENIIVPLPDMERKPPETVISVEEAAKAKDSLKVLLLERQILATAVTTIFESESKGVITQPERDGLVGKYKVELKRLEKSIEGHQRIVDLYELENQRQELLKNFNKRMTELETEIQTLKSGNPLSPQICPPMPKVQVAQLAGTSTITSVPVKSEEAQITEAEKRIEQIRSEILEAMDRLEQIETEA